MRFFTVVTLRFLSDDFGVLYRAHSRAMSQMNQMMNSFFGGSPGFGGGMGMGMGMGMLEGHHAMGHQHHLGHDLMPFGGPSMTPFGPMGGFPNFVSLNFFVDSFLCCVHFLSTLYPGSESIDAQRWNQPLIFFNVRDFGNCWT